MAILGIESRPLMHGMALSALCILVMGCQGDKPSYEKAADTSSSTWAVTVAPDESLTTEEYIKLGVPALDRPWNASDYAAAVKVLQKFSETPEKLPRYQSKKSGTLFDKLTDKRLSAPFRKKETPPGRRILQAGELMDPANRLLKLYGTASRQDRTFDAELVSLQAFILHCIADLGTTITEATKELSPDNPITEKRIKAAAALREGIDETVMQAIVSLSRKDLFRVTELVRLTNELKTCLPRLIRELPSNATTRVPFRLRQIHADETDPILKQAVAELLASLEPNMPLE